mmetsp:Transcript_70010/g.216474  ORF Transcript_70010/g.216474 Transcript_70010/m.216474 type:complete len:214 (-) Transcript_70010:155-796(-)
MRQAAPAARDLLGLHPRPLAGPRRVLFVGLRLPQHGGRGAALRLAARAQLRAWLPAPLGRSVATRGLEPRRSGAVLAPHVLAHVLASAPAAAGGAAGGPEVEADLRGRRRHGGVVPDGRDVAAAAEVSIHRAVGGCHGVGGVHGDVARGEGVLPVVDHSVPLLAQDLLEVLHVSDRLGDGGCLALKILHGALAVHVVLAAVEAAVQAGHARDD